MLGEPLLRAGFIPQLELDQVHGDGPRAGRLTRLGIVHGFPLDHAANLDRGDGAAGVGRDVPHGFQAGHAVLGGEVEDVAHVARGQLGNTPDDGQGIDPEPPAEIGLRGPDFGFDTRFC